MVFGVPGWPLAAAILGLLAGVVADVCVDALSRDEPFRGPLLRCRACGAQLRWIGALPIVGWIGPGSRCRSCRAPQSARTPFVQVVNSAFWVLLALRHGPSPHAVAMMIFVTALLVLGLIDFRCYLLPDAITLPGVVFGVAATWLPGWPVSLLDATLSASLGYFAMMALATAARLYYRREALGQGDWKLVAMLGACLGSTKLVVAIIVANTAGAVVGFVLMAVLGDRGRGKLPLGTFLSAAGILLALV